jgi:hypothetical protein
MGTPPQGHASPFARGLGMPEHESPAGEYTAAKEQLCDASAAALAATDAYRAPEPLASVAKGGPTAHRWGLLSQASLNRCESMDARRPLGGA